MSSCRFSLFSRRMKQEPQKPDALAGEAEGRYQKTCFRGRNNEKIRVTSFSARVMSTKLYTSMSIKKKIIIN